MNSREPNSNYRELVVRQADVERIIRDHEPEWEYVGTIDAHSREIPENYVTLLLRRKA